VRAILRREGETLDIVRREPTNDEDRKETYVLIQNDILQMLRVLLAAERKKDPALTLSALVNRILRAALREKGVCDAP